MATRKTHFDRPSYLYLGYPTTSDDSHYEFDESDVWNSNKALVLSEQPKKLKPYSFPIRKPATRNDNLDGCTMTATSLPVNIPDWSKILRDEYNKNRTQDGVEDDVDSDDGADVGALPPHEYLARTRIASFSVHEGIGRTLKGRDLSRVRNAVWKQTGFED